MNILIVNLHSSKNAGDHALTLETIRQLHAYLPTAHLTLAMADPSSADADDDAVASFYGWLRHYDAEGKARWRIGSGLFLLFTAVAAGLVWRITKRLPRWWFTESQYRLLHAYTQADAVLSCAGTVFYTSGKVGLQFLLSLFILGYGGFLGKPMYTLPQSMGPIRHRWEQQLFTWLGRKMRLALVREPVSAALMNTLNIPSDRYRLVPDLAFSYRGYDEQAAIDLLARYVPSNVPLMGFSVISWGDQNHQFQSQAAYEAGFRAVLTRFLAETEGHALFFPQMWGPAAQDDDRLPAYRIAEPFTATGRVHVVIEPLTPAILRACYARTDLFVGTRMHATIFALSVGTPVVAVGYRTKTAGLMEMLNWQSWLIDIDEVNPETLPPVVMKAWHQRADLRDQLTTIMPPVIHAAGEAVKWIADDLKQNRHA
jgi:colanic acid/amylovoran biosynthesis protein